MCNIDDTISKINSLDDFISKSNSIDQASIDSFNELFKSSSQSQENYDEFMKFLEIYKNR